MSIKKDSWREQKINLFANIPYELTFTDTKPTILQIVNLSKTDKVYMNTTSIIDSNNYLRSIQETGIAVLGNPLGYNKIYLFCGVDTQVDVYSGEGDLSAQDLDRISQTVIVNSQTGDIVTVSSIQSALPAGTNNIGDVDVLSLPSIPAGNNLIGSVNINSSIPAGTNNIGDVDVNSLPPLPTGSNVIGKVDINNDSSTSVKVSTTPTIYNVTLTTAGTEYNQPIPAGTKKFTITLQDFDSSAIVQFAFSSGAVNVIKFKGDGAWSEDNVNLTGQTMYIKSTVAGKTAQIICWS